jgi:hypothetical protein
VYITTRHYTFAAQQLRSTPQTPTPTPSPTPSPTETTNTTKTRKTKSEGESTRRRKKAVEEDVRTEDTPERYMEKARKVFKEDFKYEKFLPGKEERRRGEGEKR